MTDVQSLTNDADPPVAAEGGGAQLHVEDIPVLLGAIISERLFGAQRRLENGAWQWCEKVSEGADEPPWSSSPPVVVSDANLQNLIALLDNLRTGDKRLNFIVGSAPPSGVLPEQLVEITRWYRCEIRDEHHHPIAYGTGELLCAAIAVAVARLLSANILDWHRMLFPQRYLELNH